LIPPRIFHQSDAYFLDRPMGQISSWILGTAWRFPVPRRWFYRTSLFVFDYVCRLVRKPYLKNISFKFGSDINVVLKVSQDCPSPHLPAPRRATVFFLR
jgi:hypothetical protein